MSSGWRILCIDDEPDILEILGASLGMEHEVVTAKDGLEAVELLEVCDVDFIICDVRMPRMDGYQTVQAIRQHPQYMTVPVFFLTAETSRDAAQQGFASGANLYLTKPFDPMRVLTNINHFLDGIGSEPCKKRFTVEQIQNGETETTSQTTQVAMPRATADQSARPRVIIITHDERQMQLLADALENSFECVRCADSLKSLQQLFRYEPDLLLINLNIPRLSGMGFAQMIYGNRKLRALPMILIKDPSVEMDERVLASISKIPPLSPNVSDAAVREAISKIVRDPDFKIRAKRFTIKELQDEENMVRHALFREDNKLALKERKRKERYNAMQKFIDTNMEDILP